jgi:transcriptional regulator with XRE-family HTH domain
MTDLPERLVSEFQNPDTRYEYSDAVVNAFVSSQIKALREERGLRQEQLAELIGTRQSGISRLERADYSSWRIGTLRKLARAFGVRLKISFEEFGTLLADVSGFTPDRLRPRPYESDPVFGAVRERVGQRPVPAEPIQALAATNMQESNIEQPQGRLIRFDRSKLSEEQQPRMRPGSERAGGSQVASR